MTAAPSFIALAEKAAAAQRLREEKWGDAITSTPPAMCPQHPGQPLAKDIPRSAFESERQRRVVIVCEPCPMCAENDRRRRQRDRLLARGIPPRSIDVTLETWDPAWEPEHAEARGAAWKAVNDWCQRRPHPFLIILGQRGGTGKTALGVAALRWFGADIRCVEFREWIDGLVSTPVDDRFPRLDSLRKCGGVMIDDFGNRHGGARDEHGGGSFERDCVATVLNYRFEKSLPTVITTNLTPEAFAGRLDDRTVDRIKAGRLVIRADEWPSRRAAEAI